MGGTQAPPQYTKEEQERLWDHLRRSRSYPHRFAFSVVANTTTFDNAPANDPCRNARIKQIEFNSYVGLVALQINLLTLPVATSGIFGLAISYADTFRFVNTDGNTVAPNVVEEQGQVIYQLVSQGGSIADFEIFYPLNFLVEPSKKRLNIFLFSNTTDGSITFDGHVLLHVMQTGVR